MNDDVPLGAVANLEFMKKLESDPRIAATYKNVEAGLVMPNVPGKWVSSGQQWKQLFATLPVDGRSKRLR